jgi:hypothetical protein
MPTEKIKKKMVLIHKEEGMSSQGHTRSRGEGDDFRHLETNNNLWASERDDKT